MKWYHYIACFFAGAFLANTVPHFVHGISGDCFPSPFRKPARQGAFFSAGQCAMGARKPGGRLCAVPRGKGIQGEHLGPGRVFRRYRIHQHHSCACVCFECALSRRQDSHAD